MTRANIVLLGLLILILLGIAELAREESQYRRSAAYKLETAAMQLRRGMTKAQVIQLLGDTELKVSGDQFDGFEVWTWKEENYQRMLWQWLGKKPRRHPQEVTAFFTEDGLYDVMIESK